METKKDYIPINGQLFASFIRCRYKAHLLSTGETGTCSQYEQMLLDRDRGFREESLRKWLDRIGAKEVIENPESVAVAVGKGYGLITNASATVGRFAVSFEALERVSGDGNAKARQYISVIFTHREKITGHDKLLAAFYAIALGEVSGQPTTHAKIVHGREATATKVALIKPTGMSEVGAKAHRFVNELAAQIDAPLPPPLTLNDHCPVCQFRARCHAAAVEKDDISLLRGLSVGEVEQWRERGVFTVTQLSYTFRAKSVTGKRPGKEGRPLPALQALAVREKKVYLARLPKLPPATTTRVFLDVEGVPDRDFYYLIGMLVEEQGETRTQSLWADGPEDEQRIWHGLLAFLAGLGTFTAYHYGRYDRTFLDHMTSRYGAPPGSEALVERLKKEAVDVLAVIAGAVYFPTHSRSLKSIGSLLGAAWSDPTASGLQSLVWRHRWEETKDEAVKQSLIQYNREDCSALQTVTSALEKLSNGTTCQLDVVRPADLPTNSAGPSFRFGMGIPASPEIGKIIKCAYFEYQTKKVFFRTDRDLRASFRRASKALVRPGRLDKTVLCAAPTRCAKCGSSSLRLHCREKYKRIIYDLRFPPAGPRRWVVRYVSDEYRCRDCDSTRVLSEQYPPPSSPFGHGLCSWAIHGHVALRQSFDDVTVGVREFFDIPATNIMSRIKPRMAVLYKETQASILAKLRAGHVLYVDETKVNIHGKIGYVWVFSNLQEVLYLFSETRDGTALAKVLDGFKGVLVSDFYSVYDSPTCEQQKCVIHFVRDLNDDLKRHPLDAELAKVANGFTAVFTAIIAPIDRYGLKGHHLNKHRAEAEEFLKTVADRQMQSKVAAEYQRRLKKYGQRLFTFLSHDGVAWNNNAAENAVKLFASRRRVIGAAFNEGGIKDYLVFLSIFCTLRRKGGSFLKFLRSGEKNIDVFLGDRRRGSGVRTGEGPSGTNPPASPAPESE